MGSELELRAGKRALLRAWGAMGLVMALALLCAPAALGAPHEFLGGFGPDGSAATEFKNNRVLAFAEAERRLWVADLQTNRVWGFDVSSLPPPFGGLTGFSPLAPPGSLVGEFGSLAADNSGLPSAGRLYLLAGGGSGGAPQLAAYGPSGSPPSGFPVSLAALGGQSALAVDPRSGEVATLDRPGRAVRGYSPAGYELEDLITGLPDAPVALAFDTDGDLYVATFSEVRKYYAASGYGTSSPLAGAGAKALAVDTATHHLFVAFSNKVVEYDAEGAQLEEFATGISGAGFRGLAVDPADHDVYVSDTGTKSGEQQKVTIAGATGGTYRLCFEGQCTGAAGKGNLTGPAAGTGDVVRVTGLGNLIAGHTEVTHVAASGGEFKVGMAITGPGIPGGTTITYANPETQTIALSAPPSATTSGAGLEAGYVANLETASGEFKAGMEVFNPAIPETGFPKPNVIAAANGDGTLTLQGVPSESSAGASLTASSKTITNLSTESGAFLEGEAISGTGVPAGATIACVGRSECPGNTLVLSAAAEASATGSSLLAEMPCGMSAAGVASSLQKLPAIGSGNVGVSGSGSGACTSPIERTVTFQGQFAGEEVPLLECDGTGLQPGGATCEVEEAAAKSVTDPGQVRVYSAGQVAPALRLGEPTALQATSVAVHGSVDPEGLELDECHFQYVSEATFTASRFEDLSGGGSVPCSLTSFPADSSYHDVDASLSGLTPGVHYRYRILVKGPSVPPAAYPGGAFQTPAPPAVETTGSPVPLPTEAILSGRLNAHGLEGTSYHFEYGTAGPCSDPASHCQSTPVTAVRGDEVQRFRVSHNFGPYTLSFEGAETPQLSPTAGAEEAQAALEALPGIGAGNLAVTGGGEGSESRFVVSFGGALGGKDLPPLTVAQGNGAKIAETLIQGGPRDEVAFVAARVEGLEPEATYHYRLLAEGPGGRAEGADMTLHTRSTAPVGNPEFPHPPGSERAYELVSLADSGGNPSAAALGFSADGDHALYQISGGTPISQQGSLYNQLLAERVETAPHEGGWRSGLLAPAAIYGKEAPDWFFAPAADFSRFIGENTNGTGGAPEIHLWRIAPGGPYEPLRDIAKSQASEFFETSADASRTVAAIKGSLDPAHEVPANRFHLYDVSDPTSPKLLSILPGEAEEAGCPVAAEPYVGGGTTNFFTGVRHDADHRGWVSEDGSRAFFVNGSGGGAACAPSLQLYMREIGAGQTKLISGPVVSGPSCPAAFLRATDEAVFFLTAEQLTSEDSAPASCSSGNGAKDGDVYRYDLGSGALRCVTCVAAGRDADVPISPSSASSALQAVGVSEDGSAVYFTSPHALLPGAAPAGIYRADVACELGEASCPEGPLAYVAPAGPESFVGAAQGSESVVSADGNVLVFKSADPRLSAQGGTQNEGLAQYYRYDNADRSLDCLSCPSDGSAPRAAVIGNSTSGTYTYDQTYNGTMASADGRVVAFSSPSPLVGADQNTPNPGQNPYSGSDVYEWRGDHPLLVTDGLTQWNPEGRGGPTSGTPEPAAVSASGRDVFFFAAAKLTAEAIDDYRRLYDARLGGGFTPPAETPPCPLEVCQGTPKGAPPKASWASQALQGPGNPAAPARPRCRKGKVRRRGRCVRKRHHRRHHRHHRRHHRHHARGRSGR